MRIGIAAVVLALTLGVGAAFAQTKPATPTPAPAAAPAAADSTDKKAVSGLARQGTQEIQVGMQTQRRQIVVVIRRQSQTSRRIAPALSISRHSMMRKKPTSGLSSVAEPTLWRWLLLWTPVFLLRGL
jgi:hypothetical protein